MKKISKLFYTQRFHSFSTLSRSQEVLNIIQSIDPMEPSLEQISPFLSPEVISSVIQEQQKPYLCFRFFIWAAKRKRFRSWVSHNLMIGMLVNNKVENFDTYWKVLEEIKNAGYPIPSDAFAVLIGGYWEMKDGEKAVECFGRMKEFDCEPNTFTYNLMLHVLVNKGMIVLALAFYNMMMKLNCCLNCSTYNILINGLCKSSMISYALELFDEMIKRGIMPSKITYTIVLSGLCEAKRIDDAYRLFENMRNIGIKTDSAVYNALLNGVCKLGRMDEVFVLLRKFQSDGFELNLNSYSSLIDGLFRAKRFEDAHEMFKRMTEAEIVPDVVFHTIMIRGLCDEGRIHDALKMLKDMTDNNLVPDTQAYNTLIKGLCDKGFLDEARSLKLEISGDNEFPDTCTYTILISGMCRYGLVGDAQNLFNEMEKFGCLPSVVTFNALIDGLCKAGELQNAHILLSKMEIGRNPFLFLRLTQGSDKVVDSRTLQAKVSELCESGSTLKAYKLLTQLADTAIMPTITTYNILINGMCKAGRLEGAYELIKVLEGKKISPDSVTYGTLINGLQSVGRDNDAFILLEEMVGKGCKPTPAIYRTLMKWSCRRKKTLAAFNLWIRYLKSLPNRDEKVLKLVEDYLQEGEIARPVRLLLEMDIKLQDVYSAPYTIWLIGFCQERKSKEALYLFDILKEYDINVTSPSCVMLISTLCREGKLNRAIEVFLYALQKGFILKPRICNFLVKSLLRSRLMTDYDAFDLLEKMESCGYDLDAYLNDDTTFLLSNHRRKQDMQNVLTR
uniref:pentatricopeptide repeat-containing protein At1g79540 n=1 Tax=Erigeron canadensis TaxID=72917 RepID=UPI001CB8E44A|nr:pentatricopeptide repeat-containing protein At1g79540 [Erigeron canadensis]XP_043612250.1 pentatricopeptide repeat-containing protein At1g79540 [Erigeron canadensis]XP_043612251.1 pentatricopeptide repeat-containing protein At1g79540 [Erigeron canadensis]XP_043612252.1 pentatricopeptide repeat-containing protein At1g79540 [Erigeron canadensis]